MLAFGLALAAPAAARADDAALLERFRPVYVHDARERDPVAGVADSPPASYGRAVAAPAGGRWLQYWRWHESNRQDRGALRTGRHAGDWELVQVRVDRGEQPVEAVYAQHSGGERCGWPEVRTRGDAPVAYLANGSHAAYFRPGVRDRTFPDPNDEARGHGSVIRPRLVVVAADLPSWMPLPGAGARAARGCRSSSRARAGRPSRACAGATRGRSPPRRGVAWRGAATRSASATGASRRSAAGRSPLPGCWPASSCGGGAGELKPRRCARGRPGRRVACHPAPPRGRPGRIGARGASSTTRLTSPNGRDREKVRRYPPRCLFGSAFARLSPGNGFHTCTSACPRAGRPGRPRPRTRRRGGGPPAPLMAAYTTELNLPLVGMTPDTVVAEVRRALADGESVERVEDNPSGEHVDVAVRFLAASPEAADRLAEALHDRVLRAVLAAAPADRGWTSGFGPPERARPDGPTL